MFLLLDNMDISKIVEASSIQGTIVSENAQGVRQEICKDVKIERKDFEVIYFDKVLKNLER